MFNPTNEWIVIGSQINNTGVLKWYPGQINIPPAQPGLPIVFNDTLCIPTWINTNPQRREAIVDSSGNPVNVPDPVYLTEISSDTNLIKFKNNNGVESVDTSELTKSLSSCINNVVDNTKGKKYISLSSTGNTINLDATTLTNTLNMLLTKSSPVVPKKQVGLRMLSDGTIISQWGLQVIDKANINKIKDGIISIKFTTALCDNKYGVSLSSSCNGNIRYDSLTPSGFNIIVSDTSGKPSNDNTIDITLEINT